MKSELKSIAWRSLATKFPCTIAILITCVIVSRQDMYNYRVLEIVDDLPNESDFDKYLKALQRIVDFTATHKFYVDTDLCFGMYVANVYLRDIARTKLKLLNVNRRSLIVNLMQTNEKTINHFVNKTREKNKNQVPFLLHHMLNIKLDLVTWPHFRRFFYSELLNNTKYYQRRELEKMFNKWPKYKAIVSQYKKQHALLEVCLLALAQNPYNNRDDFIYCQMPYDCIEYIGTGLDYGYKIAHRLIVLLAARYWRHCFITSRDEELIEIFCQMMYYELEYMSNHQFGLPDLFMDHISLCGFEGHVQFLRRSWIESLLDFQTRFGCFNMTRPSVSSTLLIAIFHNISEKADELIWRESCNAHVTGVAEVTLATVIAFIVNDMATKSISHVPYL